jgi:PleD family two-component response regulator
MTTKKWRTLKEVIELLGVSEKTVRRRIREKRYRIMYVDGKYGDELRIRTADVMKDVQSSRQEGGQEETASTTARKNTTPRQVSRDDGCPIDDRASPRPDVRYRRKVLIVDDSPTMIQRLTTVLQKLDAEVMIAEDGESALKVMECEDPDLVIAEIDLSRRDGIKMAWKRAEMETIQDIPIVFYSYLKDHQSIVDGRGCPGVLAYFTKPLTGEALDHFQDIIKTL